MTRLSLTKRIDHRVPLDEVRSIVLALKYAPGVYCIEEFEDSLLELDEFLTNCTHKGRVVVVKPNDSMTVWGRCVEPATAPWDHKRPIEELRGRLQAYQLVCGFSDVTDFLRDLDDVEKFIDKHSPA